MEHETLKNKLESLDLGKVPHIQWDQERTWARLNAQLGATAVKKTPMWKYGIAAGILFLISSGTGYLVIKSWSSNQQAIALNNSTNNTSIETSDTGTILLDESCEEVEIAQKQTLIVDAIEAKQILVVDQTIAIKSPIIKGSEINIAQVEPKEITVTEEVESVALNELTIIPQIAKDEVEEIKIEKSKEVTTQVLLTMLTSQPITKKKKKFSIKLFQKKNKQTARNVDKVPALTLFASN